MNVCVVWAAILLIGAFACIAASPLFALADEPQSSQSGRLQNLDGLRGYLALSVALHHGAIYHGYLTTGQWTAPPSGFFNQLGQASVGLFFIITGYLFWSKILRANGEVDFPRLMVGRVFRIGPVFLAIVSALMIWALISSGPALVVSPKVLTAEALQNFALGILPITDFNGVHIGHELAGVTWTLVYEWQFYFFLPVLAVFAWRRDLTLLIVVGLLVASSLFASITHTPGFVITTLFLAGLLCATIEDRGSAKLPPLLASIMTFALLAATYGLFSGSLNRPWPALLLGLSFYLILSGADLFGLLRLRASRRLGAISYDLYLCHGAALAAAFSITPVREWALGSPVAYWTTLSVALLVALGIALMLHVLVERPGIALGRRFIERMGSPPSDAREQVRSGSQAPQPIPAE